MPFKNNSPGCPCCDLPCEIFDDDFTRANSTDLGSNWDEISGGWEISSNKLSCTSVGTLICTVPQTTDDVNSGQYVSTTFNTGGFSTGNKIRLLADATDDGSSYYGVEVEVLSNKIRLFKDGSLLVERELPTIGTSEAITLELCVRKDHVTGICSRDGSVIGSIAIAATRMNNRYTGILTAVGTATTFSVFTFKRMSRAGTLDDCPECRSSSDCGLCVNDVSPEYVKLVFSGIANNDCADCTIFNKTFILPIRVGVPCIWEKTYEAAGGEDVPCDGTDAIYTIIMELSSSGSVHSLLIQLSLSYYEGAVFRTWATRWGGTQSSEYNCFAWDSTNMPFTTQDAPGQCDASSSTCLLTSI